MLFAISICIVGLSFIWSISVNIVVLLSAVSVCAKTKIVTCLYFETNLKILLRHAKLTIPDSLNRQIYTAYLLKLPIFPVYDHIKISKSPRIVAAL